MRWESEVLPLLISSAPVCTSAAAPLICATTVPKFSSSAFIPFARIAKNPLLPSLFTRLVRSPASADSTIVATSCSTPTSCVRFTHSIAVPRRVPSWSNTGVEVIFSVSVPSTVSTACVPRSPSSSRRCSAGFG